ncbi:hypothetical protein Bca52824_010269 [Brassica carinata]|uniref:F-box associated beta-propeller type 1 domain-containing protein n=1 Tax=Brassica carinata TaxID=52824 RepID=A0A8X7WCC3_BRACI|nr:hypothetical protein Bca52824_010269 [Brassica carinata]
MEHFIQISVLCKAQAKQQFLGFMIRNINLCSLRCHLHEEEFSVKEISNQVEISEVFVCEGLLLCVTGDEDNFQQRLMVWNPYLGQTR